MLSARQKIKIDVVVLILFFILVVFLAIIPLCSRLLSNSKNLAAKKSALVFLGEQIEVLNNFQNSGFEYRQKINKLDSSFVSEEAPIEFIEFLEKEALAQNLKISLSSGTGVPEKKENRITIGFQARITGKFPDALVFLEKIEKSPWLIKIEQINIDRTSEESEMYSSAPVKNKPGEITLNIVFKTFSDYLKK